MPAVKRLQENLARLSLSAEIVVADAADWTHDPFDAVLVDAPCTATGTIRRHPDIAWLKQEQDIATLTGVAGPPAAAGGGAAQAAAERWSIAPVRSSRRKASSPCERLLAGESALRRAPIDPAGGRRTG